MPTTTFHNLPTDKRERFVAEALREFALHPYDQASITHIVKRLGIAKGSVYQYFGGKLDLFGWLIDQAQHRKVAWFSTLPQRDRDPFDQLRFAYREGLRYWLDEPLWNRVALRVLEPSTDPGIQELRRSRQAAVFTFLEGWLRQGQAQGFVRADLDVVTSARLMHGLLSEGLLAAFLHRLETDLDGFVALVDQVDEQRLATALQVADEAVEMLRRAVG